MAAKQCDVAIVGGGMVGLSLALALNSAGVAVSVIEKGNLKEMAAATFEWTRASELVGNVTGCNCHRNISLATCSLHQLDNSTVIVVSWTFISKHIVVGNFNVHTLGIVQLTIVVNLCCERS